MRLFGPEGALGQAGWAGDLWGDQRLTVVDTYDGPGNTLLEQAVRACTGRTRDQSGALTARPNGCRLARCTQSAGPARSVSTTVRWMGAAWHPFSTSIGGILNDAVGLNANTFLAKASCRVVSIQRVMSVCGREMSAPYHLVARGPVVRRSEV